MQNCLDEEITLKMVNYALEQEIEAAAWDIWISCYPHFTEETFKPFSEFKKGQVEQNHKKNSKSDKEIVDEMQQLIKKLEPERGESFENI